MFHRFKLFERIACCKLHVHVYTIVIYPSCLLFTDKWAKNVLTFQQHLHLRYVNIPERLCFLFGFYLQKVTDKHDVIESRCPGDQNEDITVVTDYQGYIPLSQSQFRPFFLVHDLSPNMTCHHILQMGSTRRVRLVEQQK